MNEYDEYTNNEYTNTQFKSKKILKLVGQYNLQVTNYIFQLLHFGIMKKWTFIY